MQNKYDIICLFLIVPLFTNRTKLILFKINLFHHKLLHITNKLKLSSNWGKWVRFIFAKKKSEKIGAFLNLLPSSIQKFACPTFQRNKKIFFFSNKLNRSEHIFFITPKKKKVVLFSFESKSICCYIGKKNWKRKNIGA